MHQILLQHPLLQAAWRFHINMCVYVCVGVYQWLRSHKEEGSGHEAAFIRTRECSMALKNTHMRTNAERQSPVVVTYWGVLSCPLLSVAPSALTTPNPALYSTNPHAVQRVHSNTHTPIAAYACTFTQPYLLTSEDWYNSMQTCMFHNTNSFAHMRICTPAYGTDSKQRGPCQSLITSPGRYSFNIVLATSHTIRQE